ncbi:MAG: hypothetical protein J0L92_38580 [Deltaproteobacteria bacterium]|nr:hypothetical protein [Deltaproteobacteria bacterium]
MQLAFPRLVVLAKEHVQYDRDLSRPLVGVKRSKNPHVAVATAMEGKRFVLAPRTSNRAADQALIAKAAETVRAQTWSWQVAEMSGFLFWKKPSMLRGMGDPLVPIAQMATDGGGIDDLATELLLIPDAMTKAAEMLGSQTLFCIVPKRGWLMVSRGEVGNPFAAQNMHAAASGIASRGGSSSIAGDVVVIWQSGKLTGVDGRDGTSGYISMQGEDESTWWP